MKIADFFGSVGFKVDIKPLDDALSKVEHRLDRLITKWNGKNITFGARINSVSLNKSITDTFNSIQNKRVLKLNATIDKIKIDKAIMANAIKAANLKLSNIKVSGKTAAIDLNNFKVDRNSLKTSLMTAIEAIEKQLQINLKVNAQTGRVTGGNVQNQNTSSGRGGRSRILLGSNGLTAGVGVMAGGPVGGLAGAVYGLSVMNRQTDMMNSVDSTLKAVSGTPEEYKTNKSFLRNNAMRLGTDYAETAHPAALMLASAKTTSMKGAPARELIEAVSEFGTVLNLSAEHMGGSFRALNQMISKGSVMSEELRQQLNEWMPGSLSMMAQAYQHSLGNKNATGDENDILSLEGAMKKRQVKSANVLPMFAQIVKQEAANNGLGESLSLPSREKARAKNQWMFFTEDFGKAGGNEGRSRFYRSLNEALSKLRGNVEPLGKAFSWLSDRFANLVTDASSLFSWLGKLWSSFDSGQKTVLKFGAILGVVAKNPLFAAFTGLYLVLEDIATYFAGGDSITGDLVKMFPNMGDTFSPLAGTFDTFKLLLTDVKNVSQDLLGIILKIAGTDVFQGLFKQSLDRLFDTFKQLHLMLEGLHKVLSGEDVLGGLAQMGKSAVNAAVNTTPSAMIRDAITPVGADSFVGRGKFQVPYQTQEQNAKDYMAMRRMQGVKMVEGPAPNITISSPITVNGADPNMYEEIQRHVNDIFKQTATAYAAPIN